MSIEDDPDEAYEHMMAWWVPDDGDEWWPPIELPQERTLRRRWRTVETVHLPEEDQ